MKKKSSDCGNMSLEGRFSHCNQSGFFQTSTYMQVSATCKCLHARCSKKIWCKPVINAVAFFWLTCVQEIPNKVLFLPPFIIVSKSNTGLPLFIICRMTIIHSWLTLSLLLQYITLLSLLPRSKRRTQRTFTERCG